MLDSCRRHSSESKDVVALIPFKSLDITITGPSSIRILFHSHEYAMEVVRALKHPSSPYQKDNLATFFTIHHMYDAMLEDEARANASTATTTAPEAAAPRIVEKVKHTDSWSSDEEEEEAVVVSAVRSLHIHDTRTATAVAQPAGIDDWELLDLDDQQLSSMTIPDDEPSTSATDEMPAATSAPSNSGKTKAWKAVPISASTSQKGTLPAKNSFGALADEEEDDEAEEESSPQSQPAVAAHPTGVDEQSMIEMECPSCSYINVVSYQELSAATGAKCSVCRLDLLQ
jgi:hypothetical protein